MAASPLDIDYTRETVPNDQKFKVSFAFNAYASLLGLPLRMHPRLPSRMAKVYRYVLEAFDGTPMAINKTPSYLSTRNLQEQITEAWGL